MHNLYKLHLELTYVLLLFNMEHGERERKKNNILFFSFFPHASCAYFDQATAKAFEIGIALFQAINFRLVTAFTEQSKLLIWNE